MVINTSLTISFTQVLKCSFLWPQVHSEESGVMKESDREDLLANIMYFS